jgi:hypothetical protein
MDKLGKLCYENPHNLYSYKGVPIPPLGMVDDILTVSSADKTEEMNRLVNEFMEKKKIQLSNKKCIRIHIGKGHNECPPVKVHENVMKSGEQEKYLGDIIHQSGSLNATIAQRKSRGNSIVAEILSILDEIPLGKSKVEIGMMLREAMLINGILFNSEAWHGVTKKNINELEKIDEALLRGMVKAHSKTPKEFLYLEMGAVPLRWVIAQRRINFLKNIIDRNDNELIKRVFNAQKESPTRGDFVQLVQSDLKKLGMTLEDNLITRGSRDALKKEIKIAIQDKAFKELAELKCTKSKLKDLDYIKLEVQEYLKNDSELTIKEVNTMFALRSKCVKGIRTNFKKLFKSTKCPLNCADENTPEDTQEHIFKCEELEHSHEEFRLEDLNANSAERKAYLKEFNKLMKAREKRLEQLEPSSLPGAILDQSTPRGAPAVHIV